MDIPIWFMEWFAGISILIAAVFAAYARGRADQWEKEEKEKQERN